MSDPTSGTQGPHRSLRRCFLAAPAGMVAEPLARLLAERGLDVINAGSLLPGRSITAEILRHLRAADLVCVLLDDTVTAESAPSLFEAGVAYGLRKPVVVITTGEQPLLEPVRGLYAIKAAEGDWAMIGAEIDRFLRHAGHGFGQPDEEELPHQNQRPDLWAVKHELGNLADQPTVDRARRFEAVIEDAFRAAGAEVVASPVVEGSNYRADLLVWLDDIAAEIGGPMIVECKFSIKNSDLRRQTSALQRYVEGSSARLALLVHYSERIGPNGGAVDETPDVLVYSSSLLIEQIEQGVFAEEVLRRRARARSVLAEAVGSS